MFCGLLNRLVFHCGRKNRIILDLKSVQGDSNVHEILQMHINISNVSQTFEPSCTTPVRITTFSPT